MRESDTAFKQLSVDLSPIRLAAPAVEIGRRLHHMRRFTKVATTPPGGRRAARSTSGLALASAMLAISGGGSPAAADQWIVTFTPYVWLQGTTGDLKIRGFETHIDDTFLDVVKANDTVIGGFAHVDARNGVWGFYLEGNYAYTSTSGETRFDGSTRVRTGMTIAEAGGLYQIADGRGSADDVLQHWRVEAVAGMRYVSFTAKLDLGPISANRTTDWASPLIGLNGTFDFGPKWTAIAHADVGGFGIGSDLMANLYGLIGYRTTVFGAN
ncbi:MAG: hypothetical protein AB7F36_07285, partial [Reyranellaceae bacterium]